MTAKEYNHHNHCNHGDAKHMTDGGDDRRLARLGEEGCQGRTHIESHLTQHHIGVGKKEDRTKNTFLEEQKNFIESKLFYTRVSAKEGHV